MEKEIKLKFLVEENGENIIREIKGKAHPKYKGRFTVKFEEKFWHKWINWDLRFIKINFD